MLRKHSKDRDFAIFLQGLKATREQFNPEKKRPGKRESKKTQKRLARQEALRRGVLNLYKIKLLSKTKAE